MVKTIFFDFDGTVFSHTQNKIPATTYYAFELLKEKGIKRVLCTGRHLKELKEMDFFEWGLDFDAFILLGGQMTFDKDLNCIDTSPINIETAKKIGRVFEEKKITLVLETKEDIYCNIYNDFYLNGLNKVHTKPFPIKEYNGEEIFQVSTYVKEEIGEALCSEFDGCFVSFWSDHGILFVDKNGGKSKGVEKYLKSVGETSEETMAFGDGGNDLDMLEYWGVGVGMGNGAKAVIENCDYVTETIDNDGIYLALKNLGVI